MIQDDKINRNYGVIIIGCFILAHFLLRLFPIYAIPPITDEPDDLFTISDDFSKINTFFQNAYSPDQARLPYFVSAPIASIWRFQSVTKLRLLFLLFYFAYVWVSYKLILSVTKNRATALLYAAFILCSCYLAGFSIFSITTAGWLYALFHILSIYVFWKIVSDEGGEVAFNYRLLAVCVGLCTASKLFGIFLLPSFAAFHWIFTKKSRVLVERGMKSFFQLNTFFLATVFVINVIPIGLDFKMIIMLTFAFIYVVKLWDFLKRKITDQKAKEVSWLRLWLAVTLTAFCITIIFSPIYLNLINVLRAVGWFGKWNQDAFVAKHNLLDIPMIMVIKFGLVSFAALLLTLWLGWKKKILGGKFSLLILLVFVVQLAAISSVQFSCTWYPLTIFPFMYLPFVFLFDFAQKKGSAKLKKVVLAILALVFIDNTARYLYWYPYAHFDGAQYGKEHIGWNKSSMVSFEIFPKVVSYLRSLEEDAKGRALTVNIRVIYVPSYNNWALRLLREELASDQVVWKEYPPEENKNVDYLFCSPIYNPELEVRLNSMGYKKIKTLSLKNIDLISVWVPLVHKSLI